MNFFSKVGSKKSKPEPEPEPVAEEVQKVPFNPVPLVSIVGFLVVMIALFGQANEIDIAFVVFVPIAAIFIGWGIWYNSKGVLVKYWKLESFAILLLVIGGIIMFLIQKGFDFVTYDQSWISPSVFFFLGLLPAFVRKRYFNISPSFLWFTIPNLLSLGLMAATVTHDRSWVLYGITIVYTIAVCSAVLKVASIMERLTRLSFPYPSFVVIQHFASLVACSILIKSVDANVDSNVMWCKGIVISGCLIGSWIMTWIKERILHLT